MKNRGNSHTRSRYNLIAPFYNIMEWPVEHFLFRKWRRQLWSKVSGTEVLEIGVGTGKNIPFYPNNLQVTGIDLSPKMLDRAKKVLGKKENKNVTLREMDAQNMEFDDNTFDEVVASFVFCSVPDPVLGLAEARRVTKPGGKLYLLEHMRSKNKSLATVMEKIDAPIHFASGVHIARTTIKNVRKAGWEIERVQELTTNGIVRMIEATNKS